MADDFAGCCGGDFDVLYSYGRHCAGVQRVQLSRRHFRQSLGGLQEFRVLFPVGEGLDHYQKYHPLQHCFFGREHISADHLRHTSQRAGGEVFQADHPVGDVPALFHLMGGGRRVHLQHVQLRIRSGEQLSAVRGYEAAGCVLQQGCMAGDTDCGQCF